MCIIALQLPNAKKLSPEILDCCQKRNDDGYGIMYVNDKKELIIEKTLDYKKFLTIYDTVYTAHNNSLICLHFRVCTKGKVSIENCHPFYVEEKKIGYAHNGNLYEHIPKEFKGYSDSRYFGIDVLKNINEDIVNNEAITTLLQYYIGSNNKMVLMNNIGDYTILNEDLGYWVDNTWFSNKGYENYTSNYNNFTSSYVSEYDTYTECHICKIHKKKRDMISIDTVHLKKYLCFECISKTTDPINVFFKANPFNIEVKEKTVTDKNENKNTSTL